MSPKKTILRELARAESGTGPAYTRPAAIRGFSDAPEKYQQAVNELLKDRLLEGRKDDEGHMTIAINAHRRGEVDRRLRPVWARPAVWVAMLVLILAVGASLAI